MPWRSSHPNRSAGRLALYGHELPESAPPCLNPVHALHLTSGEPQRSIPEGPAKDMTAKRPQVNASGWSGLG